MNPFEIIFVSSIPALTYVIGYYHGKLRNKKQGGKKC